MNMRLPLSGFSGARYPIHPVFDLILQFGYFSRATSGSSSIARANASVAFCTPVTSAGHSRNFRNISSWCAGQRKSSLKCDEERTKPAIQKGLQLNIRLSSILWTGSSGAQKPASHMSFLGPVQIPLAFRGLVCVARIEI